MKLFYVPQVMSGAPRGTKYSAAAVIAATDLQDAIRQLQDWFQKQGIPRRAPELREVDISAPGVHVLFDPERDD